MKKLKTDLLVMSQLHAPESPQSDDQRVFERPRDDLRFAQLVYKTMNEENEALEQTLVTQALVGN